MTVDVWEAGRSRLKQARPARACMTVREVMSRSRLSDAGRTLGRGQSVGHSAVSSDGGHLEGYRIATSGTVLVIISPASIHSYDLPGGLPTVCVPPSHPMSKRLPRTTRIYG